MLRSVVQNALNDFERAFRRGSGVCIVNLIPNGVAMFMLYAWTKVLGLLMPFAILVTCIPTVNTVSILVMTGSCFNFMITTFALAYCDLPCWFVPKGDFRQTFQTKKGLYRVQRNDGRRWVQRGAQIQPSSVMNLPAASEANIAFCCRG